MTGQGNPFMRDSAAHLPPEVLLAGAPGLRILNPMRNFISSLLGSLAALVLFFGAGVVGCIVLLVIISSAGEKKVVLEEGSYLVLDLSTNITDAPPLIDLSALTGNHREVTQLRTLTKALRAAARDDRIAGVVMVGSLQPAGLGSGPAALREIRQALLDFKSTGKPVKAYLTQASTSDYYVASVADELSIDPFGAILMPGLVSEPLFIAGALKKYGIGVQVARAGNYKAAVEPFVREDLSPENREQLQALLDDIWAGLLTDIGAARGLGVEQIQAVVDSEGMIKPTVAAQARLVDRVIYRDVFLDELKELTGRKGGSEPFKQVALASYANLVPMNREGGRPEKPGRVAVVYAEGDIVDGEGETGQVGGSRFARELRQLRQDDAVKAVVLRVNSPGGSATASEEIQREMRLLQAVKPVVVSMGSYAASGGYWISTYSDRIFAEPTTITGSIGVFGLLFDVKTLANEHGVTFDSVKTGRFADALSISRPKTEPELAVIQGVVDWIYDEFLGKVAESRKLERSFVEEIARGRVWSGQAAKELGLVDEMGSLTDALRHAAELAELGSNFRVSEFPRKKELAEAIVEMVERVKPAGAGVGLFAKTVRRWEHEAGVLRSLNDPRGLYARLPLGFDLN